MKTYIPNELVCTTPELASIAILPKLTLAGGNIFTQLTKTKQIEREQDGQGS